MTQTNQKLTLSEWTTLTLSKRGLTQPDGRHLYQYRITNTEFSELESALRNYLAVGQSQLNLADISIRPMFSRLFVMYGAEWWRRRYDGSGFTWEGILRDLGANPNGWNQSQRSGCVRQGLTQWKLKSLDGIGFKYLGAIALEGGLPMKTLAEARGGIAYLLGRVLRTANNRTVILEDIQGWVESLQNNLPKSYRQPAIFALLAETAWTVLNLKQKARLNSGDEAIEQLNAAVPEWRNQFPLPMEDRHARSLIEQLVREAASVKLQKTSVCLPVDRYLENLGENNWHLSSNIDLPEVIEVQKISSLFGVEPDALPRFAELSVTAGDKTRTTAIRRMAGHEAYRLEGVTWGFSDKQAVSDHILRLNSSDGRIWTAAATKGQSLSSDLLWIFSIENSVARFVCQGAGGVNTSEALVAAPSNWKPCEQPEDTVIKIGATENSMRAIYKITGTAYFESEHGVRSKVSVSSADAETENYEWRGRRLWLDFVSPQVAFAGKPKLYRVGDDGSGVLISSDINCAAIGAPQVNQWLGPVALTYQPNNELKHKSRLIILPEDADLSLRFGTPLSGTVIFDGWHAVNAMVNTPGVDFRCRTEGNSLILDVSVPSNQRAPDQLTVDLFWRHTSTPIRVRVPFPAKGVRAFGGAGNEIFGNAELAFNKLTGVRLNVLGADRTNKISLNLQTKTDGVARKYNLQTLPGAVSLDVRLTDYLTDIDHLLSLDDNPDARVEISLKINGEKLFALIIARYAAVIERAAPFVKINVNERERNESVTDGIKVLALRLEAPHEEPAVLIKHTDDIYDYHWTFLPEEREPGAWLIYPDASSTVNFRPTLWFVPGDIELDTELARITNLADQHERNTAFKNLVKEMAEDYTHSSWQEVSRLAETIGHLPLSTLDLWRQFARSAEGMAALAVRCGKLPVGFVSRFEKELPFAWEVIPYSIWKNAIEKSFEHCHRFLPEDIAKITFDSHIQRRINILDANHGGVTFLIRFASMEFFPERQQEAQVLRSMGDYARHKLFFGENSQLMNLRRIHGERMWVEDTDGLLDKRWSDTAIVRYKYPENLGKQNPVINAPLLLASEAAIGKSSSWLKDPSKIHLLRTFRAFDSEWFDEAYNWTIVRCFADGMLGEN